MLAAAPDTINGCFELFGAALTWTNFAAYCRDREVRGVYWPGTAFWVSWGIWNLFYYTALDQPLSFLGGIALTGGSAAWLAFVALDKWVQRTDEQIRAWASEPSPNSSCFSCRVDIRHRGACDYYGKDC